MDTLELRRENNVKKEKSFIMASENKQIQTRATRRVRTELRKTMFSMRTVEKWTNLAAELREAKFLYQFKNQLEKQENSESWLSKAEKCPER